MTETDQDVAGLPAFPFVDNGIAYGGLSVRAYMATQIMAGFAGDQYPHRTADAALVAVEWADALIEALNQEKK